MSQPGVRPSTPARKPNAAARAASKRGRSAEKAGAVTMHPSRSRARRVQAEVLRGYPLEAGARALGYRSDPDHDARWRPGSVLSINRLMFYDHLRHRVGSPAARATRGRLPSQLGRCEDRIPRRARGPRARMPRRPWSDHNPVFVRRNAAGKPTGIDPHRPVPWEPDWPASVISERSSPSTVMAAPSHRHRTPRGAQHRAAPGQGTKSSAPSNRDRVSTVSSPPRFLGLRRRK